MDKVGIHIQQGDPKQIPMCSVQQILTDKGVSGKHHRVHGTIIFSEGSLAWEYVKSMEPLPVNVYSIDGLI